MMATCLYTFFKSLGYATPRVNPHVNPGLWVIMMWHCRFTNFNKCPTLVEDIGNGESNAYVKAGDKGEISVPSSQFCYEPTTALKE